MICYVLTLLGIVKGKKIKKKKGKAVELLSRIRAWRVEVARGEEKKGRKRVKSIWNLLCNSPGTLQYKVKKVKKVKKKKKKGSSP